jgi:lipooligosaccharide transport system ATP-binding protein
MSEEKASFVRARALTKRYDDLIAVDGIDFDVPPGMVYGFLGPNGAGKTTTMRMVYGFTPITSGSLTVGGLDVTRHTRQIKQQLGVVPQEDNLDPDFSVLKNMLAYARYFHIPRQEALRRAQISLELMQLWERRKSDIEELSGGMKRRLLIARALINEPRLIILDEPTTGLDPQARHLVWQKLRQLRAQGVTMLLTTHYMDEAFQLCDRLVIMDQGRILAESTPDELVAQHVLPRVIELRNLGEARPALSARLAANGAVIEDVGDTLYVYAPDGADPTAALELPPNATRLIRPANLEDVFLRLTGRALQE